jgi:H+-transporting ATPase
MASSVADIVIAALLSLGGIAMTPLPAWIVTGVFALAVAFAFLLDLAKVPLFHRLNIS